MNIRIWVAVAGLLLAPAAFSQELLNASYDVARELFDDINPAFIAEWNTPPELSTLRIAPQRYAVFRHREHVSTISGSFAAIWGQWMPESGHEAVDAPVLEVYGPDFDSRTGQGGFEIWVPINS